MFVFITKPQDFKKYIFCKKSITTTYDFFYYGSKNYTYIRCLKIKIT